MPQHERTKHTKEYWDRLRKEFQTCEYQHGGAYNEVSGLVAGKKIKQTRSEIELREITYKKWRDLPTMEPKTSGFYGR
jgi:hypothetical protein